jgi:hypothetical protein
MAALQRFTTPFILSSERAFRSLQQKNFRKDQHKALEFIYSSILIDLIAHPNHLFIYWYSKRLAKSLINNRRK